MRKWRHHFDCGRVCDVLFEATFCVLLCKVSALVCSMGTLSYSFIILASYGCWVSGNNFNLDIQTWRKLFLGNIPYTAFCNGYIDNEWREAIDKSASRKANPVSSWFVDLQGWDSSVPARRTWPFSNHQASQYANDTAYLFFCCLIKQHAESLWRRHNLLYPLLHGFA